MCLILGQVGSFLALCIPIRHKRSSTVFKFFSRPYQAPARDVGGHARIKLMTLQECFHPALHAKALYGRETGGCLRS